MLENLKILLLNKQNYVGLIKFKHLISMYVTLLNVSFRLNADALETF